MTNPPTPSIDQPPPASQSDDALSSHTPDTPPASTLTGRVIRTQSGFFTVQTPTGIFTCQIAGKIKIDARRAVNKAENQRSDLVALNDRVEIETREADTGLIIEVHERRNVLSRVEPGATSGTSAESEQIILANTDQAVFVMAAHKPDPNPRTLDRFLVIAEKAQIPSIVICVNKMDIAKPQKIHALFKLYESIGYPVLYVSANTGEGIDELRTLLSNTRNQVSVFTGPSGVGKSSLLNALQSGLKLETSEVSDATTKGRHTTRFSQLIAFQAGGYVADTPGIRSIAPWDIEPEELDNYFIEMRPYIEKCKFADCSHSHEPGCAVRAAVESGQIDPKRYDSYQRLREELETLFIY